MIRIKIMNRIYNFAELFEFVKCRVKSLVVKCGMFQFCTFDINVFENVFEKN